MSAETDAARFAARAYVARLEREFGTKFGEQMAERLASSYELGYLRGYGEGMRAASEMFDDLCKKDEQ